MDFGVRRCERQQTIKWCDVGRRDRRDVAGFLDPNPALAEAALRLREGAVSAPRHAFAMRFMGRN
jgi:hypothetical protein